MIRFISILVTCVAANAVCAEPAPRVIEVTGQASVKAAPDRAVIELGVESRAPSIVEAKKQNDAAVAKVIASLREQGVDANAIQAGILAIEPRYRGSSDNDRTGSAVIEFYSVKREIGITLHAIDKFEVLLQKVIGAGANRVSQIRFSTSDAVSHRAEARRLAVVAARDNARALAKELGLKVGSAVEVVDQTSEGGVVLNMFSNAGVEESGMLGQISVQASVKIKFSLLD